MTKTETRPVSELIWREDLYPRFEPNPTRIQEYAEDIERLPPIEINQHNEIIDGYHRWTAHKKVESGTIQVFITQTESDRHFALLAMLRNARHGLHISNKEKKDWLLTWYTGNNMNGEEKQELADAMGVTLRTVKRWTARKDKDAKAKRDQRIVDMWLACYTEDEIADKLDIGKSTVSETLGKCSENDIWQKSNIFANYQDPDWQPPLYNVWKQKEKKSSVTHPGNSEISFVDWLLYLYTKPFNIVADPFAGSGSTIDVCKKRLRRYWVSDRLPIVERRDIRHWDILDGPPPLHKRWGDVSLMYLDPPYWKQAEGAYSDDPQDLANMELSIFYDTLTEFIKSCAEKMHPDSHIALLIQATQWRAPDRQIIDHMFDIRMRLQDAPLSLAMKMSCPYESQQCTATQVEWAKENKQVLVIDRELVVWRVSK